MLLKPLRHITSITKTIFSHFRGTSRNRSALLFFCFATLSLIGLGSMFVGSYRENTVPVPKSGGRYVEGFVGTRTQLDDVIAKLTSASLVTISYQKDFIPVLAEKWEVADEGKTYTFHLRQGIDAKSLVDILKENELLKTVEIQTPDEKTIVFRLRQPFGPFLSLLALPSFPHAPYRLVEEKDNEVTVEANENFVLGRPYLDKITVRVYADERSLKQAIARREVSGAVSNSAVSGWKTHQGSLPREIDVILNVEKDAFKELGYRQQLLRGGPLRDKKAITIVTTPQLSAQADILKEQWIAQNVEVSIKVVEDAVIRQTIIPTRDYDALLYGVDTGVEPDPYRFWHSSQVGESGLNLAQLKDPTLDVLLDDARKVVSENDRFQKYEEIYKKLDELAVKKKIEQVIVTYQVDENIKGVELPLLATPASRYNMVWKWYTSERRVPKDQ